MAMGPPMVPRPMNPILLIKIPFHDENEILVLSLAWLNDLMDGSARGSVLLDGKVWIVPSSLDRTHPVW